MKKLLCNSTFKYTIVVCTVILLFESCLSIDFLFYPTVMIDGIKIKEDTVATNRQNHKNARYYETKGITKMNSKDTNELKLSRQLFNASLAYNQSSSEVWGLLGDVYVKESELNDSIIGHEKLTNAIYYYSGAIALDSNNKWLYYQRGKCYYSVSNSAYVSDYRKSCELGNKTACMLIK